MTQMRERERVDYKLFRARTLPHQILKPECSRRISLELKTYILPTICTRLRCVVTLYAIKSPWKKDAVYAPNWQMHWAIA